MNSNQILIVEDDIISAEGLKAKLIDMGYPEPFVAHSGEDAIEQVKEYNPDLILMDIKLLGDIDGIDAAQKIQEFTDKPIIYLTSYSDEAIMQRAKVTAPFNYMVKPVRDRELHITIEMALYRHNLEQKLKMREKWLDTVLRSIGDGVIATDTHGDITFMNKVSENLTGWDIQEAQGRNLSDVFKIVNNTTGKTADNPAIRALKEGRIVGLANNTALIRRDGSRIIIDDSASPIKHDKGAIEGAVLVFRDVTEQHQNQIKLEETAMETDAIFRNVPSLMMLIDENGMVHRVNHFTLDEDEEEFIKGKQGGEIIKCLNAFSQEGCGKGEECKCCALRKILKNSFKTGKTTRNAEISLTLKSGDKIVPKTFLTSCNLLVLKDGNKVLMTLNDITDKIQLQQALRKSEKKYASIIEMAGEAIIFGSENHIEYNRKALEMFSSSNADNLQDESVFRFSPEVQPDGSNSQAKYSELVKLTMNGEPQSFQWQFMKTDGTIFDAEVSLSKVDVDSKPVILSIIRDITERKRAENELKERTEELEIFNRAMVDREMRIIELKEEVNLMCRHNGKKPLYDPVWNDESKIREIKNPEIY